jgi:hypothetical protein
MVKHIFLDLIAYVINDTHMLGESTTVILISRMKYFLF